MSVQAGLPHGYLEGLLDGVFVEVVAALFAGRRDAMAAGASALRRVEALLAGRSA